MSRPEKEFRRFTNRLRRGAEDLVEKLTYTYVESNQTSGEPKKETAESIAGGQNHPTQLNQPSQLTEPTQPTQLTEPTQPTQLTELTQPAKLPSVSEADFIDNNWTELVQRATGMEAILDRLLSWKVINNEQYSEINAESTPQRKMRALITGPINSSGALGKCVLYDILMEQQPYMMLDLGAL